MADISHAMGLDIALSPSGDLAAVSGAEATQQRVLRRLLTNPGDYIWHLPYGAGLPSTIGQPLHAGTIDAIVQQQMEFEAGVGLMPAPVTTVSSLGSGAVVVQVVYADQDGNPQQVSLSI